jgi:peptidoglycan hydrolase-like protein with peptidoglycan-binding domain
MTVTPRRTLLAAVCAAAVLVPAAAGPAPASPQPFGRSAVAAKPPVTMPAHPTGLPGSDPLPTEIDAAPGYQPQTSCASAAMPGVVKLRALALATYQRGGTSPATPRLCSSGSQSEHKDGRAWDWMLSHANKADRTAAADFLSWVTGPGPSGEVGEMASRLGIMYVIYNRRIWSAYSPGWRDYAGADPHTSHIHISMSWNGARAHTSFWTGKLWAEDFGVCQIFAGEPGIVAGLQPRTTPCRAPVALPRGSSQALAWLGNSGSQVEQGQELLGISASGSFDRATRKAVLHYQATHDLPRTGALDDATWASLLPSSAQLNVPDWTPVKAAGWAAKNGLPTIHRGEAGKAVYALQTALRLDDALRNGFYGPQTRAAVLALKFAAGLPATALVNTEVWNLLPTDPAT